MNQSISKDSLLLIDWDECMSPICMYTALIRASVIPAFHESKQKINTDIEKANVKFKQKLDMGNRHPMSKWCTLNNVPKEPNEIRKALGLTSSNMEPKYTKKYVSFIKYCVLPNNHIISALEILIKTRKIIILTNGRTNNFIRGLFYHKFPNTEDGKYINRFLRLFDCQVYGNDCIEICSRPGVTEYVTHRCMYKYDSSLNPTDKGLREFYKTKNRQFNIGETTRYLVLTKAFNSHISEDKSIFIFKDLIKDKEFKKYKTILYFDDNLCLPSDSKMKKVREYSYWLNKNLPHKKMEYHSASLKTPKFACFDVPKKKNWFKYL